MGLDSALDGRTWNVAWMRTADIEKQPFNAFLSGFSATVGQFVLTASLRIQCNPQNKAEFASMSHER